MTHLVFSTFLGEPVHHFDSCPGAHCQRLQPVRRGVDRGHLLGADPNATSFSTDTLPSALPGLAKRILPFRLGTALVLLLVALTACQEAVAPDPSDSPDPPPPKTAPRVTKPIEDVSLTLDSPSAIKVIDVAGNFDDPDAKESGRLTFSAKSSEVAIVTVSVGGSRITVTAVAVGNADVTVTATDKDGLTAEDTFKVTVTAASTPGPQAPVAVGTIGNIILAVGGTPAAVDVAGNFNDPDGQILTYTARSSAAAIAIASASGSTVTVAAVAEGTATITVTATDEDNLTASQTFNVTVNPAPTPGLTLPSAIVLNPDGSALTNELYTLPLGTSSVEVFVISTNTTTRHVAPNIVRLDSGPRAGLISPPRPAASRPAPGPEWLREIQLPPRRIARSTGRRQHLARARTPVAEGDSFTFIEHRDDRVTVSVPATVRKVIRAGATTLAVWVADREWQATCVFAERCLTRKMVDAIASRFLRPGAGNDIHDWVTTIFGAPWGPHPYSDLIPPEAAGEIHILLLDIKGDRAGNGIGGYFFPLHNVRYDPAYPLTRTSAERLIFFIDSPILSIPEGPTWEVTDPAPSAIIGALAHEFQHMIHFYQKLIVNGLPYSASEVWLNEMASEVTEDLVADKLAIPGPRGVASSDRTAGAAGNIRGRLPLYNVYNDIQVTAWNGLLENYSINYALGAYLARNYGGAALFREIVRNDSAGVAAIEAALATLGHDVSFADVLTDWAIANLLSDDTGAPHPYRYNSGTWFTSAGGQPFRLGSINLFNYHEPEYLQDGPRLYSLAKFSGAYAQPPHSNWYATLGRASGTVRLRINAPAGNRITVVVKG